MSRLYRKESFLRNARTDSTGQFLGLNSIPRIPSTTRDVAYVIESKYEERPDLLAFDVYGNSRYWWVFAARNPDQLKDPIRDFQSGLTIWVPAESSVAITGNPGQA
jgi:hypothetical protein